MKKRIFYKRFIVAVTMIAIAFGLLFGIRALNMKASDNAKQTSLSVDGMKQTSQSDENTKRGSSSEQNTKQTFLSNKTLPDNDNLLLGNPSNAKPDTKISNNYLESKKQYISSYNNSKKTPNWVSWHLNSDNIGNVQRKNDFRPDTSLPSSWYKVTPNDYKNSGFDKGHMCPSADRTSSAEDNSSTFLMSNMIPQAPKNNQIVWEKLESYTRALVSKGNEVYIISGPYGRGGAGSKGYKTTIGKGITVPSSTWKIIVILKNGNNDIRRINSSTRVIAVSVPNNQDCSNKPWKSYRVSVDSIESSTGYDFLSNISSNIQNVLESHVDKELVP